MTQEYPNKDSGFDAVDEWQRKQLEGQIERLGRFLEEHYPNEVGWTGFPLRNEGAVDAAIRLLSDRANA